MDSVYVHGLGSRSSWGRGQLRFVHSVHPCGQGAFGIRQKVEASTVGGVNIPSNLRYTKDHEWVLIEGTSVKVGITDYAQDALGDIVFIQVPDVGADVELHQGIGEIESTKSVNDVYSPISGRVTEVNAALAATPELLNTDPYGDGWICVIEASNIDESALMSAAEYLALTGE